MSQQITYSPPSLSQRWAVLALAALLVVAGILMPGLSSGSDLDPHATHLLSIVRANQPWNALLFLGAPAALLVALAVTELMILFDGATKARWARPLSVGASLLAGPLMLGLVVHPTLNEVRPHQHALHSVIDLVSFASYALLVAPMALITITELKLVGKDRRDVRRLHALAIGTGLVLLLVTLVASVLHA